MEIDNIQQLKDFIVDDYDGYEFIDSYLQKTYLEFETT